MFLKIYFLHFICEIKIEVFNFFFHFLNAKVISSSKYLFDNLKTIFIYIFLSAPWSSIAHGALSFESNIDCFLGVTEEVFTFASDVKFLATIKCIETIPLIYAGTESSLICIIGPIIAILPLFLSYFDIT